MSVSAVKSMCKIIAAMAFTVPLELAAAPKVVYVVPDGAGEKTGADWENAMASIGDAYASAAAFAEGGYDSGEVWIKTGRYFLPAKIVLASHVEVIGGFAGNETTSSAADPKANPVIITGVPLTGNNQWLPNNAVPTPRCYCWVGDDKMTFQYPDAAGPAEYWAPYGGNSDTPYAFGNTDNAELTGAVVRGVTLCGFYGGAFSLTTGSDHALAVVDCRLLANTTARANWASFTVTDAGVAVTNIEYCGNWLPIRIYTTTASAGRTIPASFSNCQFYETRNGISVSTVKNGADLDLTVEGCSFKKVYCTGISLSLNWSGTVRIADCEFRDMCLRDKNGALAFTGSAAIHANVDRCRFLSNELTLSGQTGNITAGICQSMPSSVVRFNACYFGGNRMTISGSSAGTCCATGLLLSNANNYNSIVNCTFETNSLTSTDALGYAGTIVITAAAARSGYANCTFVDNSYTGTATHKAEISGTPGWQTSMAFYNNLFVNPAADYRVMDITDNPTGNLYFTPGFWRCAASRWDFSETGLTKIGGNPILTNGVDIAEASVVGPNGAIARGIVVSAARDIRKTGFALWSAASGCDLVIRNPEADTNKPWRFLGHSDGTTYSDADAAALGYSVDNPLFPDAFGADRTIGKIAYGPLNAPTAGLMLLLR